MNLLSENILPGDLGKTFLVNTNSQEDLTKIKDALTNLEQIDRVEFHAETYPVEISVFVNTLVPISLIEEKVFEIGCHALPKGPAIP